MIGGYTLQAADGDGLFFNATAATGWLAGTITYTSQNAGKYIGFAIDEVRVGEATLRDQANIFGNIRVCRASPLAVHNAMIIIGVLSITWLHDFFSRCAKSFKQHDKQAIPKPIMSRFLLSADG